MTQSSFFILCALSFDFLPLENPKLKTLHNLRKPQEKIETLWKIFGFFCSFTGMIIFMYICFFPLNVNKNWDSSNPVLLHNIYEVGLKDNFAPWSYEIVQKEIYFYFYFLQFFQLTRIGARLNLKLYILRRRNPIWFFLFSQGRISRFVRVDGFESFHRNTCVVKYY